MNSRSCEDCNIDIQRAFLQNTKEVKSTSKMKWLHPTSWFKNPLRVNQKKIIIPNLNEN